MSLAFAGLCNVFRAMIVSRILYALPAFYGFILKSDIDRINTMFRKAKRWGITTDELDLDLLSTLLLTLACSTKLNLKTIACTTCSIKSTRLCHITYVVSYDLHGRSTRYDLPRVKLSKLLNSFIYRCAKLNY